MPKERSKKKAVPESETARVQFDFNRNGLQKLDKLVGEVNAATRAEVIRRALGLYSEMLRAKQRGAKLCLREVDGTEIQLLPLF